MNKILKKSLTALAIVALTGCAVLTVDHDKARNEAEQRINDAREMSPSRSELFNVVYSEEYYAPALPEDDYDRPGWFFEQTSFAYRSTPFNMVVNDILGSYTSMRYLQGINSETPISVSHNGTMGEAIQKIALAAGYAFDLKDDVLSWYKYETREFDVSFIPGVSSYFLGESGRAQTGGGSSASGFQIVETGNAGSGSQRNSFEGEFNTVDDLIRSIGMLISDEGVFNINQSTSSLVVRDYPENIRIIDDYINRQNSALNQQVVIRIEVVDVTFNDNNQTSLNLNMVRQSSGGNVIASLTGGGSTNIISNALGLQQTRGRWEGSEAFIQAMREQGIVEVVTQREILTTNNQVGSINVENIAGYLAGVGSNQTANVGSSDMLIPGQVTTGFSLQVLPRIQGDRVLVQISAIISELKGFNEATDGTRRIQTPEIDKNEFFLRNWIQNEQTLLISGLRTSRKDTRSDHGVMSMLFGGVRGSRSQQTETVILVTPMILDAGV